MLVLSVFVKQNKHRTRALREMKKCNAGSCMTGMSKVDVGSTEFHIFGDAGKHYCSQAHTGGGLNE